jgi:teichuronic acid biosynthesis glycosyltransferase TuaC
MRIAVVTTSYPAHPGDPSGHFVEAEVRDLEREGHEVTVVRPRSGGAFGWPGAASRLRERPWRALEAAAWIGEASARVARARAERVVAHWSVPSAFPVTIGLRDPRVELEVVSHGGDVRLLLALPEGVRASIAERITARASRWRFVSESLRDDLLSALPTPAAAALLARAVVAPCPLGTVDDVRASARARRKALAGRPLYVCAGRLVRSKRVDKVIDYVASTPHETPPILVVLGDGPERAWLERVAARWRMDARFLGRLPRTETLTWIGAADELIHASHAEGLSTVVREAETLGVKVRLL